MLKKFLLNTLSSFVGAWLAIGMGIAAVVIIVIACIGKATSGDSVEALTKKSVLSIDLTGEIEEAERAETIDFAGLLQGNVERPQTLNVLTKAIEEAGDNKNIKAIYLKCGGLSAGPATLHALRGSLAEFKKSGKKIYAYGDSYGQGDYYVASLADSLFINPQGMLNLHGVGGTTLFMKGLFDKLGVEFQVLKVGTFKSAVEPYILNEMSEPARAQLDTLYRNIWSVLKADIAESRGFKADYVDTLINREHIGFRKADFIVKCELADATAYEREMDEKIGRLIDEDGDDVNYVSPQFLASQTDWGSFRDSKNQVALLYACGEIAENEQAGIFCDKLVPEIVELADDDNVKAMVLRINSPGGSVFGTEQIAEALRYFKSKGKPLVISMGDYAASGGYWLSSQGDYIFADELTITGSIGIFGLIPQFSGTMSKLGLNAVTVTTNPGAEFPDVTKPMTEEQRAVAQKWIEEGYDQFISTVAKGRNLQPAYVRTIAEGRVWDAKMAKSKKLVDEFGGVDAALKYAAKKAKLDLDDYKVGTYPVIEPNFWTMIPEAQMAAYIKEIHAQFPDIDFATIFKVSSILSRKPVQARMLEFEVKI